MKVRTRAKIAEVVRNASAITVNTAIPKRKRLASDLNASFRRRAKLKLRGNKVKARPSANPLKLDPTRTLALRNAFVKELKRRFGRIRARILKFVVQEDAFGLGKPSMVGNAFCATGEGGGIDNSCPPTKAEREAEADRVYAKMIKTKNPEKRQALLDRWNQLKYDLPPKIEQPSAEPPRPAGKYRLDDLNAELRQAGVDPADLPARWEDPEPLGISRIRVDPAKEASVGQAVKRALREHGNPFQRLTIAQLHERHGGDLKPREFQAVLARLHKAGELRLGPFTQGLTQHDAPQHLIPMDREFKWYVSAGPTANASYFADCPRNDKGWCESGGGGGNQVITKDGKPIKVFHGSGAEFGEFKDGVTYFSPSPGYSYVWQSPHVVEAEIEMKNPYRTEHLTDVEGAAYQPEWIAELKAKGYDGIIYSKKDNLLKGPSGWGNDHPQYVVFSKDQIKVKNRYANEDFQYGIQYGDITTNVARDAMPQVRKEHWQEFLEWVQRQAPLYEETNADPASLKAVQHEFSQERVDAIPLEKLRWPILASEDGYVLDGNHRWIKAKQTKTPLTVLKIGLPVAEALALMRQFPKAQFVENVGDNCGIGPGGFQPGNTCAKGGPNKDVDTSNLPLARGANWNDLKIGFWRDLLRDRAKMGEKIEIVPEIDRLNEFAYRDSYKIDKDETVFFGLSGDQFKNMVPGSVVEALGTRSTAFSKERAERYAHGGGVFRVVVPVGSHAVRAKVLGERELMLLPGASFRVIGTKDGVTELEMINDGADHVRDLWKFQQELYALAHQTKPTTNAGPWAFQSDPRKVKLFLQWLKRMWREELFDRLEDEEADEADDAYWYRFVDQGFRKGAGRAWEDYVKAHPELRTESLDFYRGTREQFLKSSFAQPESVDKIKLLAGRTYSDLKNVTEDMSARMVRELTEGLARGEHPNQIGKRMAEVTDLGEARAKVVARHEIASAHSEGQLLAFKELGVEELGVAVEWTTSGRDKCSQLPKGANKIGCVCPICEALEGIVVKTSEAHGMLPAHVGCLPGNVLVLSRDSITGSSERLYDGDVVVIRTAGDRVLTCTPNHPILTDLGWVAAGLLDVGSNVVCDEGCEWKGLVNDQHEHVPTAIKEVANSFWGSGEVLTAEVPTPAPYFHGDGTGSKVAIVRTNRQLPNAINPPELEQVVEQFLVPRDVAVIERVLPRPSGQASLLNSFLPAASGLVSSGNLLAPLGKPNAVPPQSLRAESVADIITSRDHASFHGAARNTESVGDGEARLAGQVSSDHLSTINVLEPAGAVGISEHTRDDLVGDAELARQLASGGSGPVSLDQVVSLVVKKFVGHVYNLETVVGYYSANGIITHNCYCSWVPSGVGESAAGQKRSYEAIKAATDEAEELGGMEWEIDEDRPEPLVEPTGNANDFFARCQRDEGGRCVADGGDGDATPNKVDVSDGLSHFNVMKHAAKTLAEKWVADEEAIKVLAQEEGLKSDNLKESLVRYMIRTWQGSSGSVTHLEVVQGALDAMGSSEAVRQHPGSVTWFDQHPGTREALRDLGRIMYEMTQKWLADRGVKELTLYRKGATDRPFTSWTTKYGWVRQAGSGNEVEAVIPSKYIMSVPATGFGSGDESEAVVLGGWKIVGNANDFFSRCERDDKGHCVADGGGSVAEFMLGAHQSMVDSDGNPREMWHGTTKEFTEFKPSAHGAAGPGIYLSTTKGKADSFADKEGGKTLKIYANLKNPLRVPFNETINAKAWAERARKEGYDGLLIPGQGEVVVFNPSQVRIVANESDIAAGGVFLSSAVGCSGTVRGRSGPKRAVSSLCGEAARHSEGRRDSARGNQRRPVANFDPDQPRDEQGRWSEGGGVVSVSNPGVERVRYGRKEVSQENRDTFIGAWDKKHSEGIEDTQGDTITADEVRRKVSVPEGYTLDNLVGYLVIRHGNAYASTVYTHPSFRRKGVASKMYRDYEETTGKVLYPSGHQTEEGKAFREGLAKKNQTTTNAADLAFNALMADAEHAHLMRLARNNCGTGAGGFQPGNTCGSKSPPSDPPTAYQEAFDKVFGQDPSIKEEQDRRVRSANELHRMLGKPPLTKEQEEAVKGQVTGSNSDYRRADLIGGRYVTVGLYTHLSKGQVVPAVRIDFGVKGRADTSVADKVEPESLAMLRKVKEAVKAYHDAGFRIIAKWADDRRQGVYHKWLTRMGLKLVKGKEDEGVWNVQQPTTNADQEYARLMGVNAFCPTGEGGGIDPTCSPGEAGQASPTS